MMAKPIRTLELHYPMIQFLIRTHNYTKMQRKLYTEQLHVFPINGLFSTGQVSNGFLNTDSICCTVIHIHTLMYGTIQCSKGIKLSKIKALTELQVCALAALGQLRNLNFLNINHMLGTLDYQVKTTGLPSDFLESSL